MLKLIKLPGYQKHPAGIEWVILAHIRMISAIATITPTISVGVYYFVSTPNHHDLYLAVYFALGIIILVWTFIMTIWIGCWIIRIMKGPAYVDEDPYFLPDRHAKD